jgi:tetratricopeptide (TPR) repeat protein
MRRSRGRRGKHLIWCRSGNLGSSETHLADIHHVHYDLQSPANSRGLIGVSSQETLYAFYDFRAAPVSFDVMTFLVEAERTRREKGLKRLHVIFVTPSNLDDHIEKLFDVEHARWRLNNVLLPSCRLIPSIHNVTVCDIDDLAMWISSLSPDNIFPKKYTLEIPLPAVQNGLTVVAGNLGKSCQFIEASPQALTYARQWIDARANGRRSVPITLREAPMLPDRNSDPTVWAEIARRLDGAGYFPFIIRDIDHALEVLPAEFDGIKSCPEAVFNIELRNALYEESYICAFVANGPATACFYNRNVQYLYVVTGDWLAANPPTFNKSGIGFGRTPPFANHFQKWIWSEQNADMFMDEFVELGSLIDQSHIDGTYENKLELDENNREPMDVLAKRINRWMKTVNSIRYAEHELIFECLKHCPSEVLDDPDTHLMLAEVYLNRQELETSKYYFLKAVKDTSSFDIWVQLAMISERQSNNEEAIGFYEKAVRLDKQQSAVNFRLCILQGKSGNLNRMIECFQMAMEFGTIDELAFFEAGKVLEQLDQPKLALACYKSAVENGFINKKIVNRIARIQGALK